MENNNHNFSLPQWLKMLLALALVFFLLVTAINGMKQNRYIGQPLDYKNTITMSGEGKVVAVPDVMKASFGYTVTKNTVTEAQTDNVTKMNTFMATLKDKGVAELDIKTTNYTVYPEYNYIDGRQTLRGYTVNQDLMVTIRDFDKAGDLIAAAAEQGLNQVGSLQFTFDDKEDYLQEARAEAIKKAKAKAVALAKEAGVKLGKIISINESGSEPTPYPMYDRATTAFGMGGGGVAPEISAGSSDIIVTVSLTYEVL